MELNLEEYLSNGVENIVKGILKASVHNPGASMFMTKYMLSSIAARKMRQKAEKNGEHTPPFLIASITQQCNLHCKGCYARANHSCTDICSHSKEDQPLSAENWGSIFTQAEELGIEFILLAGGEPFVRKDVILMAGQHSRILFPIFTNGTMINDNYIKILEMNRNLMPVISMEGNEAMTDARRGEGIYKHLEGIMGNLKQRGILFGASITVTKHNFEEVMSDEFIQRLHDYGVKAAVYVEYVPVDVSTKDLAPDDQTRKDMMERLNSFRFNMEDMVFIAFPGDEKSSGGCLAAGRGFFHINAHGGAEPCPFSPYSDTNVMQTSLKECLQSPLFCALKSNGNLTDEHIGGCVLFEQKEQVEKLLGGHAV